MDVPEELKSFNKEELSLIVDTLNRKGIIGEWEDPLIAHFMDVKSWGYQCLEYIADFGSIEYPLELIGTPKETDRIVYDANRYTKEQALAYANS